MCWNDRFPGYAAGGGEESRMLRKEVSCYSKETKRSENNRIVFQASLSIRIKTGYLLFPLERQMKRQAGMREGGNVMTWKHSASGNCRLIYVFIMKIVQVINHTRSSIADEWALLQASGMDSLLSHAHPESGP